MCFCGFEYDKHGAVDEEMCDTRCAGDLSSVCGGVLHNSVYSVGSK